MLIGPGLLEGPMQDAIFIRSKGTMFTNDTSAISQTALDMPNDYEVGDLLVCAMLGYDRIIGTGWTSMLTSSPAGDNDAEFAWRVATGSSSSPDADDVPKTPATSTPASSVGAGQVIALATNSGSVEWIQNGTRNREVTGSEYDIDSIAVGPNANNTMVIGFYTKDRDLSGDFGPCSLDDPAGDMVTINQHVAPPYGPTGGRYYYHWAGWGYIFQSVSAAVSGVDIGYSPTNSLATYSTMYARFGIA